MNDFINNHGTKLYGGLTSFFGTLQALIVAKQFDPLLTPAAIGWLGIVCALATAVLGAMTVARGFNNSTQVAVAKVIDNALHSSPPPADRGFLRPFFGIVLAGVAACLLLGLAGCSGTRAAYEAAQSRPESVLPDTAYVIAEQYRALVKEAADLKDSGRLPAGYVAAMQKGDANLKPLVLGDPTATPPRAGLRQLAEAFQAVRNAQTEADLQRAVDDAVLALADFLRAVEAARGAQ